MPDPLVPCASDTLVGELRALIERARGRVAQAVNSELVWLYWQVGVRLRSELLGDGRAPYGNQIIEAVAAHLMGEFGRGFNKRHIHYMVRFAEVFPDTEIVHALRAQLSWTHLRELIAIDEPLKRQFYTEPRSVVSSAGAPARSKPRWTGCSLNARPSPNSPRPWSRRRWTRYATRAG